jgi:hypothetical protein
MGGREGGMKVQVVNIEALERLRKRVGSLAALDFGPLMEQWEEVLVEDNRKGVLEGKDGWGKSAPPLRYRNGGGTATRTRTGAMRGVVTRRAKEQSGYTYSNPAWFGKRVASIHNRPTDPHEGPVPDAQPRKKQVRKAGGERRTGAIVLPNNNLSTAAYRRLTGPRLAPRRESSRVITNYFTMSGRDQRGWFVQGAWLNVVNAGGDPFLQYHFDGEGQAKYDLRRVRKWGLDAARKALREYVKGKIRNYSGGETATTYGQKRVN